MSATPGQSLKGKDNLWKQKGVCWNCGEKGHYKDKCPKPAKKKDDTASKTEMANAAIASDSKSDAAFLMVPADDGDAEIISEIDCDECDSFFDGNLDMAEAVDTSELAAQVYVSQDNTPRAEIYDSGCSNHLTPYHDALTNFVSISPKSFHAANKQSMNVITRGQIHPRFHRKT